MFTLQRDTQLRLLTSTYCNFLQGAKIVVLCKPGGNEHLIRISQPRLGTTASHSGEVGIVCLIKIHIRGV